MDGEATGTDLSTQGAEAWIIDSTMESFEADVLEGSMTLPVIVDFWAPWCGPCKQLTPMLEKLTMAAGGKVRLVKVNIDENQQLAAQLRIQSVPTVYAFKDGKGLDGFQGAIPESQLRQFFERLVGEVGQSPGEAMVEEAEGLFDTGDFQAAAQSFAAAVKAEPENLNAICGLARCYVAAGDLDEAVRTLELVPKDKAGDPLVAAVKASIELGSTVAEAGGTDLAPLQARIEANPKDLEALYELAEAQIANGAEGDAMDTLLDSIAIDRNWNDEAARKKLLTLFDAFGPTHELTLAARRRLSSILFA